MASEIDHVGEYLCDKITGGTVTQEDRDKLLVIIYKSLWTPEQLDARIRAVIASTARSRPSPVLSALAENRLPWIIVLILVLVIAALLGVDLGPLLKGVR